MLNSVQGCANTLPPNHNHKDIMAMTVKNNTLTQTQLKQVLDYDPETGLFTRIKNKNKNKKVGSWNLSHNQRYLRIRVFSKRYFAHRLAWLYVYGYWPHMVDHIDRNSENNRIANLRECTHAENMQNRRAHKKKSGLPTGVRLEINGTYQARIQSNGAVICLGTFDTPEEASAVYQSAKKKMHTTATNLCL